MKNPKKPILFIVSLIITVIVWTYLISSNSPIMTKKRCKKYIIEHIDSLKYYPEFYSDNPEKSYFRMEINDLNYYEEITFTYYNDTNSCYVIFWGDRDSWKWDLKLDKNFIVDMAYSKYKGKNTKIDSVLFYAIDKKYQEIINK